VTRLGDIFCQLCDILSLADMLDDALLLTAVTMLPASPCRLQVKPMIALLHVLILDVPHLATCIHVLLLQTPKPLSGNTLLTKLGQHCLVFSGLRGYAFSALTLLVGRSGPRGVYRVGEWMQFASNLA